MPNKPNCRTVDVNSCLQRIYEKQAGHAAVEGKPMCIGGAAPAALSEGLAGGGR